MKARDYAYIVSLAVGGILAAGLIFYFILGKNWFVISDCVIYESTGLYCPGCGGTRAVWALLQGDVGKSFLYHPVVPYSCAVYVSFLVTETISRIKKSPRRISLRFWKNCIWAGLLLLLGNMLVRNILWLGCGIGI